MTFRVLLFWPVLSVWLKKPTNNNVFCWKILLSLSSALPNFFTYLCWICDIVSHSITDCSVMQSIKHTSVPCSWALLLMKVAWRQQAYSDDMMRQSSLFCKHKALTSAFNFKTCNKVWDDKSHIHIYTFNNIWSCFITELLNKHSVLVFNQRGRGAADATGPTSCCLYLGAHHGGSLH